MKPVSMWVILGMSLFLTLNSEAEPPVIIDGVRQQLPPMGSVPANPFPVSQTKSQNASTAIPSTFPPVSFGSRVSQNSFLLSNPVGLPEPLPSTAFSKVNQNVLNSELNDIITDSLLGDFFE